MEREKQRESSDKERNQKQQSRKEIDGWYRRWKKKGKKRNKSVKFWF